MAMERRAGAHTEEDGWLEDRHEALRTLRAARRRNRLARLDRFDAFYKAYLWSISAAVAVWAATDLAGDAPVTANAATELSIRGPALLGLLVALTAAVGLRSGGRGGPLAFEPADVRHLLLAPVDKRDVIRAAGLRQLRYVTFLGTAVGFLAGVAALRRLPGSPAAWLASGAAFGASTAFLAHGSASVSGGRRTRRSVVDVVAFALIAWTAADVALGSTTAPTSWVGAIGIAPLALTPVAVAGVAVAGFVGGVGVFLVDGCSLEAAERRSRLVGQLRFAATLQDVRTVMVIQRQLAQEHVRQRPWIRISGSEGAKPRRPGTAAVLRSVHGLARWPALRLARLVVFVALAAGCAAGVWAGTAPLIVPGGILLWLAALDLLEPLAAEGDRPDRLAGLPIDTGWIWSRHLLLPGAVLGGLVIAAALPLLRLAPSEARGALAFLVPATVLLPLGAAAVTVVRPPDLPSSSVIMPEIAGLKFVWRTFGPPVIAALGLLPLVFARNAVNNDGDFEAVVQAMNIPLSVALGVGTWCLVWVRHGHEFSRSLTNAGARAVGGPDAVAS